MISKDEQRHDALVMPIETLPLPSFDRLDELLIYNPEDGQLRWKTRRSNVKAGSLAGYIRIMKNGRQDWKVRIDGKMYYSARIIFMLYYHEDPGSLTIDHIDKNPLNNRITNLRLATAHEQNMNTRCISPSTATRYRGIVMASNKNSKGRPRWIGQIQVSGHNYAFGSVAVSSIDDPPPDWLIARSARLYTLRDDPDITDATLIDEINALKRPSPVTTAAE